jgi:hypothetical protein
MQDVPQFVLRRLREKAAACSHPDADLLTAFAEQALPGGERARVMEHLAACGDCRDVVALALPVSEVGVSPVSVTRARSGWLGLPILRWGALAAGLTVVISIGILQYSHDRKGDLVASNRPQEAVTLPSASNPALSTQATVSQTEAGKQASSALGHQATVRATGHELVFARPAVSASAPAGSNPTARSGQEIKNGTTSESSELHASSPINSQSAATSQNQFAQEVAQNEMPLRSDGGNTTNLTSFDVVKAKDPVPAQASSSDAPTSLASPSPLQTSPSLMSRALPRWTVSSSGLLQRSFDAGNTWENVNPALSAQAGGSHPAERTSGENETNSTPANNSSAVFHAVAALGLEVWAGGSGGILYHTSDGGNHWIRVSPGTASAGFTGDIVGIRFADPQHGKISTSNAELWTTSDTGQTWQKQQ